jgi:signal transduction histidine kinase
LRLEEFVADIIPQIERLASQKEMSIHSTVKASQLLADPIRLKQVLLIILDNAIRNNQPGGSIQFETFLENDNCVISVSDNGKGIPAQSLDKVYDRFYKVNNQSSPEYRGSGLGLSIAKSLVEGQHGTIQITSLPGKGTQVRLSFPRV